MQYCRGYYTRAVGYAHKSGKACLKVDREIQSARYCQSCTGVLYRTTDSRICYSRSFGTSSYTLGRNNEVKTNDIVTNTKARIEKENSRVVNQEEDFFGFEEGQGVVVMDGASTEPAVDVLKKYEYLFKNIPKKTEEKIYITTFGSLRYDIDNQPQRKSNVSHFEEELDARMKTNDMAHGQQKKFSSSIIDDQYFQPTKAENWHQSTARSEDFTGHTSGVPPNYLEEQYFGNAATVSKNQKLNFGLSRESLKSMKSGDQQTSEPSSNLMEEQSFPSDKQEIEKPYVRKLNENASTGCLDVQENPIEEQYFGRDQLPFSEKGESSTNVGTSTSQQADLSSSFIEKQYFNSDKPDVEEDQQIKPSSNLMEEQSFPSDKQEIEQPYVRKLNENASTGCLDVQENPIEEQYFGRELYFSEKKESSTNIGKRRTTEQADLSSSLIEKQYFNSDKPDVGRISNVDNDFIDRLFSGSGGRTTVENKCSDQKLNERENCDEKREDVVVYTGLRKSNPSEKPQVDIENPKTAYDFAMKLRHERGFDKSSSSKASTASDATVEAAGYGLPNQKVDSFGFRLYSDQVIDLEKEPEFTVLKILKDSALYNENDILALAKPYGLPVHHGAGHRHFLTKFLPDLAKHFCMGYENQELYTVHRLDKETTGVILLAKTQEMAKRLNNMFAKGEVKKTYWALTKGIPSPLEGIIDIPIGEATVAGKLRMVLKPTYSHEVKVVMNKSSTKSQKAITHYKVLGSFGNAALVELLPTTGVKHQLRVHMASALACPILGDHKYSHLSKLAPQKLSSDVLQRLGMRQSKVRTLSMHLHARGIILPELVDGKNIVIGARLPKHFMYNMKKLKIKVEK